MKLSRDKQRGIKGNLVNVPLPVIKTVEKLPRRFDEAHTIQLKFMRKRIYKNPYMYENIRPLVIKNALDYLITTELYRENNIQQNVDWLTDNQNNILENRNVKFIVDPDDQEERDKELSEQISAEFDNELPNNNSSPIISSQNNSNHELINSYFEIETEKPNENLEPMTEPAENNKDNESNYTDESDFSSEDDQSTNINRSRS
jgi:hypothetical protein